MFISFKMNIVDVGAGKYTRYGKWLSNFKNLKIYAFEPHPGNFKKLEQLQINLPDNCSSRLFISSKAVSNKNGKAPFYISNDTSSSSLLPFILENVRKWKYPIGRRFFKTIKTIEVETVKLTDVFNQYNIKAVELLNVDTQGNSLDVLSTLNFKQFISMKQILVKLHSPGCVELYKNQCESYDIVRLLKRRYFQLFNTTDYSHSQEQILNFINEPMKNRGAPLHGFVE